MKIRKINRAQITCVYWPAWRAAEKFLTGPGNYSKIEAEEVRQEIHVDVTGSACSSKDLTNRQLDACLARFAAIATPGDGARQAELADGACKRVRHAIGKIQTAMKLTDGYIDQVAVNMHRRSLLQCDESQLKNILKALTYHEKRHSQEPTTAP